MCVGNEQCQIREMQKMTACRHFFVFFLFDRAVLGAGGTCLARTEVERRCPSDQEISDFPVWHCVLKYIQIRLLLEELPYHEDHYRRLWQGGLYSRRAAWQRRPRYRSH